VALEGALKLKEIAYIHAEGFAAGELKHGPIALIEPGQPVFVIVPGPDTPHELHAKVVSNIQEIRARGARTLVVAQDGDEAVVPFADEVIRVPRHAAAAAAAAHRRAAAGLRAASWRRPRGWTSTSRATSPSP
jgi:glucosamine--fructose-6-phosphate aminotransferase (isomerizing)